MHIQIRSADPSLYLVYSFHFFAHCMPPPLAASWDRVKGQHSTEKVYKIMQRLNHDLFSSFRKDNLNVFRIFQLCSSNTLGLFYQIRKIDICASRSFFIHRELPMQINTCIAIVVQRFAAQLA